MRCGADAVILDEQRRVLLCHRRDIDYWNLPGGLVEDGEAPWDAAIREVREEIGVNAEVIRLTGLYWKPAVPELVFNFECRLVEGVPTVSDEADDVRYFRFEDLPTNTLPKQVQRISDVLEGTRLPVLKVQSGPGVGDPGRRAAAGIRHERDV